MNISAQTISTGSARLAAGKKAALQARRLRYNPRRAEFLPAMLCLRNCSKGPSEQEAVRRSRVSARAQHIFTICIYPGKRLSIKQPANFSFVWEKQETPGSPEALLCRSLHDGACIQPVQTPACACNTFFLNPPRRSVGTAVRTQLSLLLLTLNSTGRFPYWCAQSKNASPGPSFLW